MSAHHGSEEHAIHVPQPSFSPPLIALGVMLLAFGILVGIPLLVAGGVIFVLGIATWLIDDARAYLRAGEPADDHGAHH
jgi:hypothetical protein